MSSAKNLGTINSLRKPNRSNPHHPRTYKRVDAYDPTRAPLEHNGEQEVAVILTQLKIEWVYEKWQYRVKGSSIKPDFWIPRVRGREIHIEVTDSANEWGCNKWGRLSTLESRYRIPVWFINSYALERLRRSDGAEVAHYCLERIAFKPEHQYGQLWSALELLRPLEQAA